VLECESKCLDTCTWSRSQKSNVYPRRSGISEQQLRRSFGMTAISA
jgi:hypothetical protein